MPNVMQGPGQDLFGRSQALWGDVPADRIFGGYDRDVGWGLRDDFKTWAATGVPSSSLTNHFSDAGYYRSFEVKGSQSNIEGIIAAEAEWTVPSGFDVYSPNGQAILLPTGAVVPTPGAITFTPTAAADNMQLAFAANQARATALYQPGCFSPYPITSGVAGDVIFETRFMFNHLATGFTNFFIGLANTLAVATAVPCATTSFSTVPSYLGFGSLSGDPSGDIGMVWSLAGQAVQSQYMSAALTPLNLLKMGGISGITPTSAVPTFPNVQVSGAGGIPSLKPSTYEGAYLKLGFRYSASKKQLTPYINGVAQDGHAGPDRRVTYATGIHGLTTYGYPGHATLWPAAPMTFAAGLWQTSTTYQTMTIDWWECVQLAG